MTSFTSCLLRFIVLPHTRKSFLSSDLCKFSILDTLTAAMNIGSRGFKQREQRGFDKQRSTGNPNVEHSWVSEQEISLFGSAYYQVPVEIHFMYFEVSQCLFQEHIFSLQKIVYMHFVFQVYDVLLIQKPVCDSVAWLS